MQRANAGGRDTNDLVLIAANPRAGAGSPGGTVERLASVLRHYQFRVEIYTDLDAVTAASERAWQAGHLRALVAAGGDGTVAELVNRTPAGLPIAVFPLGTCNLLAGYLKILPRFQPFARMLRHGATVRLDAGSANGRIFLLMVGCGFDAEVVQRLHSVRVGHISMWSYAKPIFESIRSYQYPELRIYCDSAAGANGTSLPGGGAAAFHGAGQGISGPSVSGGGISEAGVSATEVSASGITATAVSQTPAASVMSMAGVKPHTARWLFVVNLPCYAAKIQLAPGALGTDGKLEVATFRYGSLLNGLRYLGHLWTHQLGWLAPNDYGRMQARQIRVEADVPVHYQLDGDPGGMLPLSIEVLPGRLNLFAPPERVAALSGLPA